MSVSTFTVSTAIGSSQIVWANFKPSFAPSTSGTYLYYLYLFPLSSPQFPALVQVNPTGSVSSLAYAGLSGKYNAVTSTTQTVSYGGGSVTTTNSISSLVTWSPKFYYMNTQTVTLTPLTGTPYSYTTYSVLQFTSSASVSAGVATNSVTNYSAAAGPLYAMNAAGAVFSGTSSSLMRAA
jgi:hypothetical protein